MKKFLLFIIFSFHIQLAFSQKVDSYLGTWDGFGYIENVGTYAREGCMSRLVIEKYGGQTDSLKCTLIYIPTNSWQYLPRGAQSRIFWVTMKNGILVKGKEKTITYVNAQNQERLYSKELWSVGVNAYLDLEYVYTRALNPQLPKAFFDGVFNCQQKLFETRVEALRDNTPNWNAMAYDERRSKISTETNKITVNCMLESIDLSKMKFSYSKDKWGFLTIDIPGITPIRILMDQYAAQKIIDSRNVKLDFQEVGIHHESENSLAGFIIPLKVEVTLPDYTIIQYPQPKFLYLSAAWFYPDLVRMPKK